MSNVFQKLLGHSKPRAIAFVDFEHWYISMSKLHGRTPDVRRWYRELQKEYNVIELAFFADFTGPLGNCLSDIRAVTNIVIDTHNGGNFYKKDFTDFIMLDYIYRKSITKPKIDAYILFTGDSHFTSVVNFLRAQCKKDVVIFGVKNAFARLLKEAATRSVEVPTEADTQAHFEKMVIANFDFMRRQTGKKFFPTFRTTVSATAEKNGIPREEAEAALRRLIEQGYVLQKELPQEMLRRNNGRKVTILEAQWDKIEEDGLCEKQ